MKNFELTPEEIQELRVALREAKRTNAIAAYKINTILLLGTGWSIDETIDALFLDDETVRSYANKYRQHGIKGLLETNYKGRKSKLSDDQIRALCHELDSKIYLTIKEICFFVEQIFYVKYTESGMADLLHRLDYVYKKPKLVPNNPDEEAQDEFLKFYLDFMENKPSDEVVFFADGVHPQHNSLSGYGWIRKGEDRELKSNTGRSRFNIHGAMNAETFETTIVASESNIDQESTIALFMQLLIHYPTAKKIHVILDNAKYHYSKTVRAFASANKINLVYLPAYSPELNLIERLWKVFKKNVIYNKYYEKFDAFKEACLDFFGNQTKHLGQIASIMGDGLEALSLG